jgi:hypothetical protein
MSERAYMLAACPSSGERLGLPISRPDPLSRLAMLTLVLGTFVVAMALERSAEPPAASLHGGPPSGHHVTFHMIGAGRFVPVALDGGTSAEFELVSGGGACAVQRELAEQLWPSTGGAARHLTTLTIGDLAIRNVSCVVAGENRLALDQLGWAATFDDERRELIVQPAAPGLPPSS